MLFGLATLTLPLLAVAAPSVLFLQDSTTTKYASSIGEPINRNPEHGVKDFSDYTILEILDATLHREHDIEDDEDDVAFLPLARLAHFVNKSKDARDSLTVDGITLLAPDDDALARPGHHDDAEAMAVHPFHQVDSDDDDEEKKERFARIIAYILKYHTLDTVEGTYELANKSTIATTLSSGRSTEDPKLRIRVEPTYQLLPYPHPILEFNFFVKKVGNTILAKNGIIHLVNKPLLPPFTPLNDLFLVPQVFSTLTSGLQKVDLDEEILPSHSMIKELLHELSEEHGRSFTIFAPTNFGFARLGKWLNFFFSPYKVSRNALKYTLAYHIIPDIIFHSDYFHNDSHSAQFKVSEEMDGDKKISTYQLPTLLATSGIYPDATMKVEVIEYRRYGKGPLVRDILIAQAHPEDRKKGPVKVFKADAVARFGAIHTLNEVLRPPYHHGGDERMQAQIDQIFA